MTLSISVSNLRTIGNVLIAGVVFCAGAFTLTPAERPDGRRLAHVRGTIEIRKPCVVLIGNSTLNDSTDPVLLGSLLNTTVEKAQFPGSATAVWYVYIHNVLAAAKHRPRYAVIFFRDNDLTNPDYRVAGNFRKMIQELSVDDEPTLRSLAPSYSLPFPVQFITDHSPFIRQRALIRENVEIPFRDNILHYLTNKTYDNGRIAEDRTFADERLDRALLSRVQFVAEADTNALHYDFNARVDDSFLPLIADILKSKDIQLIVVRLRRVRDALGEPEPENLVTYISSLQSWLAKRDIPMIDFTHDQRIGADLFAVGDHLSNTKGMQAFTPILASELAPYIQACPPTPN